MLQITALLSCDFCERKYYVPAHPLGSKHPVIPEKIRAMAAAQTGFSQRDGMDLCAECRKRRESDIEL